MDQPLSLVLEEIRALRVGMDERFARLESLERDRALLFDEIDKVKSQLSRLESTCARIELSCNKMSGHVDFVEDVYATVRSPFSRILRRFMGVNRALPEAKIPLDQGEVYQACSLARLPEP
jgi:hypothetical protein